MLMQAPVVPMSFLRAKPIGVMQMIDQGEQDDKIIAVHADDPEFRDYDDINQLPKHRLAEIRRYNLWKEAYAAVLPTVSGFHCDTTHLAISLCLPLCRQPAVLSAALL